MAGNESMIELTPILHLPPVNKEQMAPYALARYLNLLKNIYDEVSLDELCEDDLVEEEKAKRKEYTDKIVDWVQNCSKDSSQAALVVYQYATVITDYLRDLKRILRTAYERKAEKQRQETEKKEGQARQEAEKQMRLAALEEMDPPLSDAKKYLTPEEEQQFRDEIPGAIDAYLHRNKKLESLSPNLWQVEAYKYNHWVLLIKERKEEERRKGQAQIERDQYIDRLTAAVEKFRAELSKSKKPKFGYPPELKKYKPNNWCNLPILSKQQIHNWSEPQILESLPKILTNLTRWDTKWQVRMFPETFYELVSGIPCLTWYFDSEILVTANLELKKCVIRKRCDPGYTVEVQGGGEKLGTIYLGPVDFDTSDSFTTPIVLLSLLAKGDLESPGITIIEQGFSSTTYTIQGFEKEVVVDDNFRRFIKDIAKDKLLGEALLAKGLIEEDTAKLVEEKGKLPLPPVSGSETIGKEVTDEGDLVTALGALGYKKEEIKKMVDATPLSPNMSLEEKVEAVLKFLDSNSL